MCPEWTLEIPGAPGEIRTHDLCLRRAALYPAELRALLASFIIVIGWTGY
jgi:hypothetical protein